MSSVSSVGGNAQSLYQFIQSLSGTTQSQSTGAASGATSSTTSNSATQTIAQAAQSIGQALQGGHHHHHGGALKQIQNAVTSALQSAQSSGSTSDPNKIVEDAISQVLGNNNAAVSSTSGDTDGAASGTTGTSGTSAAANTQSFFQTLQSFGVSPHQFQQDLLSAVKDAQNGTVNNSTAFQNFQVGSTLDAIG
ncbi:MAG TPA: hypothetical protein VG456_13300 [Candidatus Sulfopaludibacter sp.]|nr:hypothetical protein [Candidatus Sulfopaludibacter sp.]